MRSWVQCCMYPHLMRSFDEKETDTDEKLGLNEKLGADEKFKLMRSWVLMRSFNKKLMLMRN